MLFIFAPMKCDARYLLLLLAILIIACGGSSDDSPMPPDEDDDDDFSLDDDEFGSAWPLAVEVTIATETIGEVTRTFQLVDTYVVAESAAAPETDEGFDPEDDAGPDLEPNPDPIDPGLEN